MATVIIKSDIERKFYEISKLSIHNTNNVTSLFGYISNKDNHWGNLIQIDSNVPVIIKVNNYIHTYINESINSQTTIIGDIEYLKCLNATVKGLIGNVRALKTLNIDTFVNYKKDIKDVITANQLITQYIEILITSRMKYLEVHNIPNTVYTLIKHINKDLRVVVDKSDINIKGKVDTASIMNELKIVNRKAINFKRIFRKHNQVQVEQDKKIKNKRWIG